MSKFLPPNTTTAIRMANTPLKGELLFDTDLDTLFIGDGITVGGIEVGSGGGGGSGDMTKAIYDTDNDGIVDEADVAAVADLATHLAGNPSINQYYGTNNVGTKGFYNLPSGTGGGVTSYNDLTDKPTLGTASSKNSGTGAGEVLLLTESNKLPALDGSLLTGISGGGVVTVPRNQIQAIVLAGLTI